MAHHHQTKVFLVVDLMSFEFFLSLKIYLDREKFLTKSEKNNVFGVLDFRLKFVCGFQASLEHFVHSIHNQLNWKLRNKNMKKLFQSNSRFPNENNNNET